MHVIILKLCLISKPSKRVTKPFGCFKPNWEMISRVDCTQVMYKTSDVDLNSQINLNAINWWNNRNSSITLLYRILLLMVLSQQTYMGLSTHHMDHLIIL